MFSNRNELEKGMNDTYILMFPVFQNEQKVIHEEMEIAMKVLVIVLVYLKKKKELFIEKKSLLLEEFARYLIFDI